MVHRHLNNEGFTAAAIDDVISRGSWTDWVEMRNAALMNRTVLERILRVCCEQVSDPYAQRYHFWMHYAKQHLT